MTTNQTPWDRLEQYNAGWNIPLFNHNEFAGKINELISCDYIEFQQYLIGSQAYLNSTDKTVLEQDNHNLFLENIVDLN